MWWRVRERQKGFTCSHVTGPENGVCHQRILFYSAYFSLKEPKFSQLCSVPHTHETCTIRLACKWRSLEFFFWFSISVFLLPHHINGRSVGSVCFQRHPWWLSGGRRGWLAAPRPRGPPGLSPLSLSLLSSKGPSFSSATGFLSSLLLPLWVSK